MRAVVQRVARAQVTVGEELVGAISRGLLVLVGVGLTDTERDGEYLAEKTANLRIFEDEMGKMNRSLLEIGGEALVVSQFTLWGDCRRGRRPSFSEAAPPELGEALYEAYCRALRSYGVPVRQGRFRAEMLVEMANDGPVTILLDSRRLF